MASNDSRILLCLSSGFRPRYRDDIVRALAMPPGAGLRFRYSIGSVAPAIRDDLDELERSQVLVAYIDQTDPSKDPVVVPVRMGLLTESRLHGTTSSLEFRLGNFAWAEDVERFNEELRSVAPALPRYDTDGRMAGYHWLPMESRPSSLTISAKLAEWEKIVDQLVGHDDFKSEPFFYFVMGVSTQTADGYEALESTDEGLELASGSQNLLSIYHYHPKTEPRNAKIHIDLAERVGYLTSKSTANIDSRYDLKTVRFVARKPSSPTLGHLSFSRSYVDPSSQESRSVHDFELQIGVKSDRWGKLGRGVLLGVLIAGPSLVSIAQAEKFRLLTLVLALGLGIAAGVFASFKLENAVAS